MIRWLHWSLVLAVVSVVLPLIAGGVGALLFGKEPDSVDRSKVPDPDERVSDPDKRLDKSGDFIEARGPEPQEG